jgi:spore maturation protein CgeB
MKIAVLFPHDSPTVAWSLSRGIEKTLARMGHEVLAIPIPTTRPADDSAQEQKRFRVMIEQKKKQLPLIEEIAKCDAVIVSGPEHIAPWIEEVYEKYEWTRQVTCPKAAWLHESMERDDYQIDFEAIQWVATDWFFPAIQDAERYDQEMFVKGHAYWLPFGVDTEIFKPFISHVENTDERGWHLKEEYNVQTFDVAFIGSLYPKRIAFLTALSRHDHPPIRLANVVGQDIHGYDPLEWTKRYASNLREVKVLLNLPSMSKLVVPRVYEVLACGTFLMTPMLPPDGGANRNMTLFDGSELLWYRSSNLPLIAQLLHEWSSPAKDEERRRMAAAGCAKVQKEHSLEKRLTEMLEKIKVNALALESNGLVDDLPQIEATD